MRVTSRKCGTDVSRPSFGQRQAQRHVVSFPRPNKVSPRRRRMSRKDSPGLFLALLILTVWLPIPLGSNRPWSSGLMEVWICVMAATWLWRYGAGKAEVTPAFRKAKPVLALLAIWLAYGFLQMAPLPYEVVRALSPNAAEAHEEARLGPTFAGSPEQIDGRPTDSSGYSPDETQARPAGHDRALGLHEPFAERAPATSTLTLDIHASLVAWLKSLAYVLFFGLTLLLVKSPERLRTFAYVLVFSGLGQGVYGSLSLLYEGGGSATGTFANRNHFAGYLVLCLSVGIGLLIASTGQQQQSASWRQRMRHIVGLLLSPKAPLRLFLAIMVIALVLTHSRMGNASFFISILIAGLAALVLFKRMSRPMMLLIASLIAVDLAIIGSWVGIDRVKERIEQTSLGKETRDEVDVYTWNMVKDYPLTGSGAGSYYGVFPRYRQADVGVKFYNHAHNDYLEFLSETGAVGFALLAATVALSLAAALRAQRKRRNGLMRGMGFAAGMAITAMLIHSAVEFNLQIPAYAATMMALLAVAWLSLYLPSSEPSSAVRHGRVLDPGRGEKLTV